MKTQLMVLALSAILVVSLSTAPVQGQQLMENTPITAPIVVSTDKDTYMSGDTIMVSGMVSRGGDGAVTIQIVGPDDTYNRVGLAQSMLNIDRTFEAEFTAGGPLMSRDGVYTIIAQYGSSTAVEATTTFEFTADESSTIDDDDPPREPDANIGDSLITIEDADDKIAYEIQGGRIISVVPSVESASLVITIETTDDGSLTMTIPRTILDAKTVDGEMDDDLFILIDGEEVMFDEERTEEDRTVTIEFMHGAETIEIIGTWVIPEFGVIAVMILAVAIVSIIAISSKSRLSVVPRF